MAEQCDMDATAQVAMQKVAAYAAQRRVRFDDFFRDYDKLRTGCVTTSQFVRVLTMHHVPLDADEMRALTTAFAPSLSRTATGATGAAEGRDGGACDGVCYAAFVRALRPTAVLSQAFAAATTASAQTPPLPLQQQQQLLPSSQRQPRMLAADEEAQLQPVMRTLQHAVRTRGLHALSPFRDFDALHTGKVTAAQFARGVAAIAASCGASASCACALQPDDAVMRLWLRKYGDGHGSVYYAQWCRDVDARSGATHTTATTPYNNEDADNNTTNNNNNNNDSLPATRDAAALASSFAAWVLPSAHVTGSGGGGAAAAATTSTYTNATLDAAQLMRILRRQCARYKLRCDDGLVDCDVYKTGTVSAAHFASALGRLRLVQFALTHENVQTLCAAYAATATTTTTTDDAHTSTTTRIDYKRFLHDLYATSSAQDGDGDGDEGDDDTNATTRASCAARDTTAAVGDNATARAVPPPQALRAHTSSRLHTHAFLTTPAEQQAAEQVLRKVRRLVAANRIFLWPIFRDFDRVRTAVHERRTCTRSRFARALATQKVCLTPDELQLLVRTYTLPLCDGRASDEVDYYAFVHDVDASLSPSQPQPQPQPQAEASSDDNNNNNNNNNSNDDNNDDDDDGSLEAVLRAVAQQCAERELRLADVFADFDTLRTGAIPASKLASALSIANVRVSAAALQRLHAAYRIAPSAHHDAQQTQQQAQQQAQQQHIAGDRIDTRRLLRDLGMYVPHAVPTAYRPPASTDTRATMSSSSPPPPPLSAEQHATWQRVLRRLRHDTRTRGALLTPFFADFDRSNSGKVPSTCFVQALARHAFALSADEVALLCACYAVRQGGMTVCDYRRFVRDVDTATYNNAHATTTTTTSTLCHDRGDTASDSSSSNNNSNSNNTTTTEEALARVCAYVRQRRPRVHEFFGDGDALRHGCVSAARFRHCLGVLGLTLRADELAALERGFALPTTTTTTTATARDSDDAALINYPAFVHAVRCMLADGNDMRDNNNNTTTAMTASACSDTHNDDDDTTTTTALYTRTLQKIRRTLASRRGAALPAFREYDRARRGFVKEGQFFACLLALGVQLTPHEAAVVRAAHTLARDSGEVAYEAFAHAVDDAALVAAT